MYKEIICNFQNLQQAYCIAHRGKTNTPDVIEFDKNKMYNLHKLLKDLQDKNWDNIFIYYRFMIYEPKERVVDAMRFGGRIVQHVLCDQILRPYFENRLIYANCACRVGKGTQFAMNLLKQGMVKFLKTHKDGYVLKMDVKKYFPSIDRSVLKDMLKSFPDKEVLELLYYIIDHSPTDTPGVGLPLGNQTSQWFALYYLDKIDRTIKEKYRIKYYVRYMDDLIIIHEDKSYLNRLYAELNDIANNKLHLSFNSKTQIFPLHKGISFLGWKFLFKENNKIILKIDRGKIDLRKSKINDIINSYQHKAISKQEYIDRMIAVNSNLIQGNTYGFRLTHKVPNKSTLIGAVL